MKQSDPILEDNPAAMQPASSLVHGLMHFLRIARLRKNALFGSLLVFLVLGGLYYASATRYYESKASLLIHQNGGDTSAPSMASEGGHRDIMPTYQKLVRKSKVLEQAIHRIAPEFRIDFQGQPRDKWVGILKNNLSVSVERRTNILDVGFRSKDPEAASAIVSAVIGAYVDYINQTHHGLADELKVILSKKMVDYEQKIAVKRNELSQIPDAFLVQGGEGEASNLHPLLQGEQTTHKEYLKARGQRITSEVLKQSVDQAIQHGGDLQQYIAKVNSVVGSELLLANLGFNPEDARIQADIERTKLRDMTELETVRAGLGENHPRVIEIRQRIERTNRFLVERNQKVRDRLAQLNSGRLGPMLRQMLIQAVSDSIREEAARWGDYQQARQDAQSVVRMMDRVNGIRDDLATLKHAREAMITQIESVGLSQAQGDIVAKIVEEPVSNPVAVSPRLPMIGAASLFLALICGSAVVYVMDILDDRFRSPEELQIHLGVPMLAMVRRMDIDDTATGMASVQTHVAPDSPESEAFRTLRTALAFSDQESGRLVISSSEPGDVNTTVLVNLAASLAQSGKKTLLIDADLRRPGLTALLGLKGSAGVTNILRGSNRDLVEQATHTVLSTEAEGLDVLPSGPRQANPSELLVGQNFADLLAWAESVYDQVLVDSPPVLAASDSQIISRLVDGVILVVNSEKNRRRTVIRAVDSFKSVGAHVFGVVANRIGDESSGYGYGYGYGYTYDYATAPETDDLDKTTTSPDASVGGIVPRRVA